MRRPKQNSLLSSTKSLALLWVIGLVFVACGAEGSADQPENADSIPASTVPPAAQAGGDATEYVIHHANGEVDTAEDMAGVQAVLPFQVVTPQLLTHDMYLKRVAVSLPPEHLNEVNQGRNTRVGLTYGNAMGTASFMLRESILEEGMAPLILNGPGTKNVITIAGNRGQMLEDKERQSLSLAWTTCGVQFVMDASTAKEITTLELVRIADSTSAC